MFSTASFHPVAYFAILAAIFATFYVHHRQLYFLLWTAGWAALAVRQLAVAIGADTPGWLSVDAGLLMAAGILLLLGGVAFSGRRRLGLLGAGLFGLALGAVAALVLTALAALAPGIGLLHAGAFGILVAGWLGTGWLVQRYGRDEAPTGAPLAGIALLAWGLWLPVTVVLAARLVDLGWQAEVDAALGALVAVGMAILGLEESRAPHPGRADTRRLLDDDPNMIAVMQGRRIVYANPAFLARLGRELEELASVDTLELVAQDYREEAVRRREMREAGAVVPDYEIELVDARGGSVPVIVHADPIVWEGRPAQRYELTDITPRRRAEEEVRRVNAELMRMNRELERVNRLQSEFLSNTTHELKTPLTSIMANTEILEYEMCGPVNDEQRRVLNNISRNSQNLLEMISRLLDFARQRAGATALHLEEVRPREILESVAETVRPLLEEKRLAIDIRTDDVAPCWLDGEKIYRIYLNLTENAIKFSTEGTIVVSAGTLNGEFEGSVADEGIGVPPERLEDIFHAFTQVDASSTRSYPGVGLGLAICRQLVELHGGRIWAESELGGGSTFRFRVPCTPPIMTGEDALRSA
jgi:PAS domain S-box-containing protein